MIDDYSNEIQQIIDSSRDLESLKLLDCNVGGTLKFNNVSSKLKHLTFEYGQLNNAHDLDAVMGQLESFQVWLFDFKKSSLFLSSAKKLKKLTLEAGNTNQNDCLLDIGCSENLEELTLQGTLEISPEMTVKCENLKKVTLINCYIAHQIMKLTHLEELHLLRSDINQIYHREPMCATLQKLVYNDPDGPCFPEVMLINILDYFPNLRYLKISQDTEETEDFTSSQTYELMKYILEKSDLTFLITTNTLNNYGYNDVVVVEKESSSRKDFDFKSTFFVDFFPVQDVFNAYENNMEEENLHYAIRTLEYDEYTYEWKKLNA